MNDVEDVRDDVPQIENLRLQLGHIDLSSSFLYDNVHFRKSRPTKARKHSKDKKKARRSTAEIETDATETELKMLRKMGLPTSFSGGKTRRGEKRRKKRTKAGKWREGSCCEAYYQLDGLWYPVRVVRVNSKREYRVRYVGYGNEEDLPECWLREATKRVEDVDDVNVSCATDTVHHKDTGRHVKFDDVGEIVSDEPVAATNLLRSTLSTQVDRDTTTTKRRDNISLSTSVSRQESRIDYETSNPHAGVMDKYWNQRYRYFSRFDQGIRMDPEAWFSVTPERIASHIAKRCTCGVIIDAFAGAGGNAIQFARFCTHVIAIDVDPRKIEIARNNAAVYGVADKIEFIVGDFLQLLKSGRLYADIVFIGPPWGGPEYLSQGHFRLDDGINVGGTCNGTELFRRTMSVCENVVYLLPRNVRPSDLRRLAGLHPSQTCEMERNFINHKIKMVTAYFGPVFLRTDDGGEDGDDRDASDSHTRDER